MTHHEHPNATVVREGFAAMQRGDTAWMDEHLADDVVWHVGGNSKWAGTYEGKAKVLEYFGRQAQATETAVEIHDILGNDDHVVVLGSAKATAQDGSSAEWKYTRSSTSAMGRRPRSGDGRERRRGRPVPRQPPAELRPRADSTTIGPSPAERCALTARYHDGCICAAQQVCQLGGVVTASSLWQLSTLDRALC